MPAPTKACIICGEKRRCAGAAAGRSARRPASAATGRPPARASRSRKPEVDRAARKPSPMADAAAALGPVAPAFEGRGGTEDIQRSDRCVLTLTPMVFGGARGRRREGDYDRLLASPRSLRSEADAFAKAGRFALAALRDPAAAFSTLAGRTAVRRVQDCRDLGDDVFTLVANAPRTRTRRGEVNRAAERRGPRTTSRRRRSDAARETSRDRASRLRLRPVQSSRRVADPAATLEPGKRTYVNRVPRARAPHRLRAVLDEVRTCPTRRAPTCGASRRRACRGPRRPRPAPGRGPAGTRRGPA